MNLWSGLDDCVASLDEHGCSVRSSGSLLDDLRLCDLVCAGNSTVLLDAVIAGRPGCYVRGFDHGPYDVQAFVRDGLIYEWIPQRRIEPAANRGVLQPDRMARRPESLCGRRSGGCEAVTIGGARRSEHAGASALAEGRMRIIGVIPARMGSSRFPGKPLAMLHGMPMLGHVYFRSRLNRRLAATYIATCDEEIRALREGDRRRVHHDIAGSRSRFGPHGGGRELRSRRVRGRRSTPWS